MLNWPIVPEEFCGDSPGTFRGLRTVYIMTNQYFDI